MWYEKRQKDGFLIFKPLTNELEFAESNRFQSKLIDLFNEGNKQILVDFQEVKELDSTAVSAIVHIALYLLSFPESRFGCFHVNPQIKKIFHITHADHLLPIFNSEHEAINTLLSQKLGKKTLLYFGSQSNTYLLLNKKVVETAKVVLCKTFPEVIEKSKDQSVMGLFVEEGRLDEVLLKNLIKWTSDIKIPLIILLKSPKSVQELSNLKAKGSVIWTVESPIHEDEAEFLIEKLSKNNFMKEISEPTVSYKLVKKYIDTIPAKLTELEQLMDVLIKSPNEESFTQLSAEAHKFFLSAGSFGYVQAGLCCNELKILLNERLSGGKYGESLDPINTLFRKIKFYFNFNPEIDSVGYSTELQSLQKGVVLLVSEDVTVLNIFQRAASAVKSCLEIEKEPEKALKRLSQQEIKPDLIIVEKEFLKGEMQGIDFVKVVKRDIITHKIKYGCIVKEDNLDENLKAAEAGVSIILKKPISYDLVENLLEKFVEKSVSEVFRVMVVDSDPNVKDLVESLNDTDVLICTDETKIFENLYKFHPNLLFLNINQPKYDGWVLLNTIRMDLRYKFLKIVMLTDAVPENAIEYWDKFDDIWLKPLNGAQLKLRIDKMKEPLKQNSELHLSSFLSYAPFCKKLQSELVRNPEGKLVVFGNKDYKSILQENSLGVRNEYITASENFIQKTYASNILKGYIGSGLFAIFLPEEFSSDCEREVNKFINETEYRIVLGGGKEPVYNTFSALVISNLEKVTEPNDLLLFAKDYFEKNIVLPSQKLTVDY